MGYYINGPPKGKALMLKQDYCAVEISAAKARELVHSLELGVVVVVDNGPFEAAGYAYTPDELEVFLDPRDDRPKTILSMNRDKIRELSDCSY